MKLFVFVAAAAMTLASCQKNEVKPAAPQDVEYTFLLGSEDDVDSKATIGENNVVWEIGDKLGTFTTSSTPTVNGYSTITPGTPASISVYARGGLNKGDMLYFYYPYSNTAGDDVTVVSMSIPTLQEGEDDMPMASLPFEVTETSTENQTPYAGQINLVNLAAIAEFNVFSSVEDYQSELVESVEFTVDGETALAGNFTFDLTTVDYSDKSTLVIEGYAEKSVVASVTPATFGASSDDAAKVNMIVAPGTYTGTVVVETDKASYTFSVTNAKEFVRSAVKPLAVDLAKGERVEKTVEPETTVITWDLSQNETSEVTTTKIAWISTYATVVNEKGNAGTDTNNYYGGDKNNRTSTRFYKNSNLTIEPGSGYAIISVVFAATSGPYAQDFLNSTWTNAVVSVDADNNVTIIPADGLEAVCAKVGGTCGFTSIVVNFVPATEYVKPEAPKLTSITLSGQKMDYFVGDEFYFDGTVTANYSYGSPKVVTDYTVSTPDMSSDGTETVTVTYTEGGVTVSETYDIALTVKPADDDKPTEGPLVWTLVTNSSDLSVGDEVIIAAKDYNYALSTTQNTNNRGREAIVKNGNTLETPNDKVQILTLAAGTKSGTFAFYTGSKYLYAASSSGNNMKEQTSVNDNASWKVTISSDGTASIVAQGTNTRNTMRYNNSSSLFSTYAASNTMADIVIYKQMPSSGDVGGTTPEPEDPETPDTPTPGAETTVTMTTFSATSASMDKNVSYITAKGGGTSAPAINDGEIRLYQNSSGGGTITITVNDGCKLQSVTVGSSMATKVAHTMGTSTSKSGTTDVSANGKYTVSDITENSITFHCMGGDKNSRLYVNYLSVTYQVN